MTEQNGPMGFQTRSSPKDGLDDFPTPLWATRAFIEHGLPGHHSDLKDMTVWEPCANRGYMVKALKEYFGAVFGTDIHDYGAGFPIIDFLQCPDPNEGFQAKIDFIVTNPPFNIAEDIFHHWHDDMPSVQHLALLLRTSWLEGWARYDRIFGAGKNPSLVCPYVGRVPMVEGRLTRKGATQMPYAWFVWDREKSKYSPTRVAWIPAKRADWERDGDWPEDETTEPLEMTNEAD